MGKKKSISGGLVRKVGNAIDRVGKGDANLGGKIKIPGGSGELDFGFKSNVMSGSELQTIISDAITAVTDIAKVYQGLHAENEKTKRAQELLEHRKQKLIIQSEAFNRWMKKEERDQEFYRETFNFLKECTKDLRDFQKQIESEIIKNPTAQRQWELNQKSLDALLRDVAKLPSQLSEASSVNRPNFSPDHSLNEMEDE